MSFLKKTVYAAVAAGIATSAMAHEPLWDGTIPNDLEEAMNEHVKDWFSICEQGGVYVHGFEARSGDLYVADDAELKWVPTDAEADAYNLNRSYVNATKNTCFKEITDLLTLAESTKNQYTESEHSFWYYSNIEPALKKLDNYQEHIDDAVEMTNPYGVFSDPTPWEAGWKIKDMPW